jgi:prevent-host-death family protein
MRIASVADVKAQFSAYLKASEQGPVVVTRNGKPVAVVLAVADEDELERLMMAHLPRLQAILTAARERLQAGAGIPGEQFWAGMEGEPARKKPGRKRQKTI